MDISQLDSQSLQKLVDELLQSKSDLEAKRYVETSLAHLSGVMRWQPEDTLQLWGDRLLNHIIEQIDGLQACLYMLEQNESGPFLKLLSSYATAPEFKLERVGIGEGVVGQVARSLKPVFYTHLTQVESRSYTGLTVLSPRTLLIQPLIYNEKLEGVLEITAVQDWQKEEPELIGRLSEIVAANIMSIRSQEAMRLLYLEAQEKTEALIAQEEEMRQNVEELQATQEEMQKQQQLLAEREARMSAIINSAKDLILGLNSQLEVVLYNQALLHFTLNTQRGKNVENARLSQIVPPEVWKDLEPLCIKALAGAAQSQELSAQINGVAAYYDITLSPIVTAKDEVTGVVLLARDITSRKNQERELLDFKAFIESVLNSTSIMFIATDMEGIIKYWNNAAVENLGYSAEEIVGKLTPAVFHDLDEMKAAAEELSTTYNTHIPLGFEVFTFLPEQGKIFEREWTYIHKDGSRFPVLLTISAWKNADGKVAGLLGVAQNLTEKKKTESYIEQQARELAQFKNFMESALNSTELAFIATDNDGLIQYWNRASEIHLGYKAEEVIGKLTPATFHYEPELIEAFQELYREYGDAVKPGFDMLKFFPYQGKTYEREWTFIRKNGSRFPGHLSLSGWKDANGNYAGLLGIVQDITQKKKQEETIRAQNHELMAREEELRQNLEELAASRQALEKAKEETEKVRIEEANRTREIIDNQKRIMAKAIEKMQLKERELQSQIESQAKVIADLQQQLEANNKTKKK